MLRGTAGGAFGNAAITGGTANLSAGTVTAPSLLLAGDTATGWFSPAANTWSFAAAGTNQMSIFATGERMASGFSLQWSATTDSTGGADTVISRAGANSVQFGASAATTTSRVETNKAVTAFSDAVAKTVLTVTIPNAAHNATLLVTVAGALGAGGAIGAGEAMATNTYMIGIVRTAGVATVATATAATNAVAVAVAGAATVTATAVVSAISGGVGVSQAFTVNVTITKSGGASDNHTAQIYARLLNANATGITIS